jgi:hypothetical protein
LTFSVKLPTPLNFKVRIFPTHSRSLKVGLIWENIHFSLVLSKTISQLPSIIAKTIKSGWCVISPQKTRRSKLASIGLQHYKFAIILDSKWPRRVDEHLFNTHKDCKVWSSWNKSMISKLVRSFPERGYSLKKQKSHNITIIIFSSLSIVTKTDKHA